MDTGVPGGFDATADEVNGSPSGWPAAAAPEAGTAAAAGALDPGDAEPASGLPIEGFDQLTLGALRGRLRRLTPEQLAQLRAHEVVTGQRPAVLTMLDNRIAKLAAEGLSGSDSDLITDGAAPPE